MPRRRYLANVIQYVLIALLVAVFLLMTVAPLVESLFPQNEQLSKSLEWTRSRVMETMIALWFFALGSMVGSFINVVVWRMPLGVSVVSKGSACPNCRQKIRFQDNIPIFGWIKLGGRCRVCKLPISSRYPIVEAIFGVVFLTLFFVQLQTAGENLPGGSSYPTTGILQVIVSTKWDVVATYAWHLILFVMLMTWALMAYDGSRIPTKTAIFAIAIGAIAPAFLPYLHPAHWIGQHETWFTDFPFLQRTVTGMLGVIVGFLVGSLLEAMFDDRKGIGLTVGTASIGLFLGWQAVLMIMGLFGVICLLLHKPTRSNQWPPAASLALATFIHHLGWNSIHKLHESRPWICLVALGIGLLLTFVVSRLPGIEVEESTDLASSEMVTSNSEIDDCSAQSLNSDDEEETVTERSEVPSEEATDD